MPRCAHAAPPPKTSVLGEDHGQAQLEIHCGAWRGPPRGRGPFRGDRRSLGGAREIARRARRGWERQLRRVGRAGARSAGAIGAARGDRPPGREPRRSRRRSGDLSPERAQPANAPRQGTAEEIAARARAQGATMLVLDAELSPSQMRNLEDAAGIAIADREAVILNVFLRHARTRRARIQIEVAQLEYLRPRIRGVGLDMDQQTGGMARARGPGETASELMARKLDGRLEELRKALRRLDASGRTQRKQRGACKRMVLVGYTNAGKTSLMNALTGADLSARDMPFETLDTTSRSLTRHGGDVLISDTVGFIRRLPERLLASFESTLAEIVEASLLVLVVDASDHERELHLRTARELIEKIGAKDVPRFYVFNKLDRLPSRPEAEELERWSEGHPWAVLSSHDAVAVADLAEALLRAVRREEEELSIFVPYAASEVLAIVYRACRVLESVASEDGLSLRIQGPGAEIARIRAKLEEVAR
ncbi:GTP-binding protein HflX [Minicystis rosea]|nr:GTP-binding protein HflX [Minicystis rosea]